MAAQTPSPHGQDDACDPIVNLNQLLITQRLRKDSTPPEEVESHSTDQEEPFLSVAVPFSSPGYVTFGYERALQNRIFENRISRNGEFDMRAYTPTFVHDCLMLPGSLACVIGKSSQEYIIQRKAMTPALLPGFNAHVHFETQQPCVLQSPRSQDYVQGMLIFGQGKKARELIHQHYRPHAKRIKVQVELDVQVRCSHTAGDQHTTSLKRKRIWAHAWLWSNIDSGALYSPTNAPPWTLEDYVAGNYDTDRSLQIETDGRGDEIWEVDSRVEEGVPESVNEEREVVYSGHGCLDYAVSDRFTGW